MVFDVLLEFDAEWSVVPDRAGAAVDLRGLKDIAASFTQRHELLHDVRVPHVLQSDDLIAPSSDADVRDRRLDQGFDPVEIDASLRWEIFERAGVRG